MLNDQKKLEVRTENTLTRPYKLVRIELGMEKIHIAEKVLEIFSVKNVNVFGTFSGFTCFRFYMSLPLQCFLFIQVLTI